MQQRPPLNLGDALRHRWLLVLAIVGVFLLAAGVLARRPPVYQASAAIFLDISRTAPGFDEGVAAGELLQHDFIVRSTSRAVLEAACASAGVSCTGDEASLAKRISASAYRGTSTLLVTATAPTAGEAAALANAVAQAIIDQDNAEIVRLFKRPRADLEKQLTDLNAAMDSEQQALQHSPTGSPAAAAHQAQLTRLQSQYSAVFARQQDLSQQQARLTSVATVQQPALPPAGPVAPSPRKYLLAALIAGLCLGTLAALLIERFDDRIFNAEGLARAINGPVALVSPRATRRQPSPDPRYALALASLLAHSPDARTVLVTAASARDHSDAVAAGLGAVAAQAGQRVVVVQSDGHSRPHREVAGMTTITAPSDHGTGITAAVTDVRKQRDLASPDTFVLVAVPSPDTSPSALVIGRTAKRTVLVATAGVTRFQDARRTVDLLQHSGIEVAAGVLLTRRAR